MVFHMVPYLFGLVTVSIMAAVTVRMSDNDALSRSMAAVLLNWLAGITYNSLTGITDGWQFNILIDSITATVILFRPAGKWQALLGVTYCVQIAMHGGYGALSMWGIPDPHKYYIALTAVAWLQLGLVGGWCGGISGGHFVRNRIWNRRSAAAQAVGRGVAKSR